jgi:hypothetical protein
MEMRWADKVYAHSQDFVHRQVAGEFLLIPIRRHLTEVNALYVLNETGAAFWRRIDGKRSVREILNDLAEDYDVTGERLEKDFDALISDLLDIRAIDEVDVTP